MYQHHYNGGYQEYRGHQIAANKAKLDRVWAENTTLSAIVQDIESRNLGVHDGVCHGARNGWEVEQFNDRLAGSVIGTDISETAEQFPDMVCHDFHEEKEEWENRFGFIYTNSLDQAFDPAKALRAWSRQLRADGVIYIEHTMAHSPSGAGSMDPFGAHPMVMPYLIAKWGNGDFAPVGVMELDVREHAGKDKVWVFLVQKLRP